MGEKTSDDELRSMINEFDKDGDGESKGLKKMTIIYLALEFNSIQFNSFLFYLFFDIFLLDSTRLNHSISQSVALSISQS